jgi:hypothetical protein
VYVQIYSNDDALGILLSSNTREARTRGGGRVGARPWHAPRRKSSFFGERSNAGLLNSLTIDDTPEGTRYALAEGYVSMPQSKKDSFLAHRKQVAFEILWLFCGLHGKVKGFSRSARRDSKMMKCGDMVESRSKGIEICPEDRYAVLVEELDRDVTYT